MALLVPLPGISSIAGRRHVTTGRIITGSCNCSSVKEAKVSNLRNNINNVGWLYGQFSAPVKPTDTASFASKKGKEKEEETRNYYVNTGYAIRTIRDEFPELFYRELSFDIYRDDIVFKDPLNTFVGIQNYKSIFWALRFHGKILFRALWVDIASVWQPAESMIVVRWTVHGIPRVPWDSRGQFDGTSEYKLDKNGKIYEHRVHNIALNAPSSKFQLLAVEQLIQSVGYPSSPKPTCFEFSSCSTGNFVPLAKLMGLKHYLASVLIRGRISEVE